MESSGHILSPDAATNTEAIHTNADLMGHGDILAHSDFFPNGGDFQPGCGVINFLCNHYRYINNGDAGFLDSFLGVRKILMKFLCIYN